MGTLSDKLNVLAGELQTVALEVEQLEADCQGIPAPPEPPPPEPPPPVEPPPPPEPPSTEKPARLVRQIHDRSVYNEYMVGLYGRYSRSQDLVRCEGITQSRWNFQMVGGKPTEPKYADYRLLLDGLPIGTAAVQQDVKGRSFVAYDVDWDGLPSGYGVLDLEGIGDPLHAEPESVLMYPVWVEQDGPPTTDWMPVWSNSKESISKGLHIVDWVPAIWEPTTGTVKPREYPQFSEALEQKQLWGQQWCPVEVDSLRVTTQTADGLMTVANKDYYKWSMFTHTPPKYPLRDGPKGKGAVGNITHLWIGRADVPGIGRVRNIYFAEAHRIGKVRPSGEVVTLLGYRSPEPDSYWGDDDQRLELVGNWDAVQEERRGIFKTWGFWFREKSLISNTDVPMIDQPAGPMHPHLGPGPQMFIANGMHNNILMAQFNGGDREQPAVVTEIATGLGEPFDITEWSGQDKLIWSERTTHRVVMYDPETQDTEVLLQGPALATLTEARLIQRLAPLETIRAADIVMPEGLYYLPDTDGTPWLYIGSAAMGQIKRLNLITRDLEVYMDNVSGNSAQFHKFAMSDGTAGPRGAVGLSTWSKAQFGAPKFMVPDAASPDGWKGWPILKDTNTATPEGPMSNLQGGSWNCACDMYDGMIAWGGGYQGLTVASKRLDDDPAIDRDSYVRGRDKWKAAGLKLTNGQGGWGHYGLPLPWGQDPDIDYFLELHGHARP